MAGSELSVITEYNEIFFSSRSWRKRIRIQGSEERLNRGVEIVAQVRRSFQTSTRTTTDPGRAGTGEVQEIP